MKSSRVLLIFLLVACMFVNVKAACYNALGKVIPCVPTLSKPANNELSASPSPSFSWTASTGASSYTLQFSTESTFPSNKTTKKTGISSTATTMYGLYNGIKYYWQVIAVNSNGSTSSSVRNFTVRKAITTNGNGGTTDVGIWYMPYCFLDPQAKPVPGDVWSGVQFKPQCSDASDGYCSTLDLRDPATIDYQLKNIAHAKIDFLIFDNTNGGFSSKYSDSLNNFQFQVKTSGEICKRIKVWNDSNPWKIRYVQAIGGFDALSKLGSYADCIESQATICWNTFVQNIAYGGADNWYYLDGKPLLIVFIAADASVPAIQKWYNFAQSSTFNYTKKFTVRFAGTGQRGMYGWPAYGTDFTPSNPTASGTIIDDEVELVSPGYRPNPLWTPYYWIPRANGQFYSVSCWDRVLANKLPRIVVIASFNDYWEQTAVWPAIEKTAAEWNPQTYPNIAAADHWLDSDGLPHYQMYWNMTKSYITRLRGGDISPTIRLLLE
jgi:hypothetical protein